MAKRDKTRYLAYIGTTKVAFLKAYEHANGKIEVNSLSARLAKGFEQGVVKDLIQASQTLNEAVQDVLGSNDPSVTSCRLVVSNVYLKHYTFQSSVYFQ